MKLKKNPKGVYQVSFKTEHGPRVMTTDCTNAADARKVVKQSKVEELELAGKVARLTHGVVTQILVGKKVSVAKAVEEWEVWMQRMNLSPRTVADSRATVDAWVREMKLADLYPASITEEHISQWINDKDSQLKLGTRMVMLAAIRSFFRYCIAIGYVIGNPSHLVRINMNILTHEQKEKREKKVFTDAEIKLMVKETKGFWRAAIVIGRWTGLRLGDICQLEWTCFNKPGRISVWTDKRDRRVDLPMNQALSDAIATVPFPVDAGEKKATCRCHRGNDCPIHVFPSERMCITNESKRSKLSVQFGRICAALELHGHSFHDLRHTYCTDCDAKGIPIEHISRNVGHVSPSTTHGYIHRKD